MCPAMTLQVPGSARRGFARATENFGQAQNTPAGSTDAASLASHC